MLRHIDRILDRPEIAAIHWVHGVGEDAPITQWLPVIRKIQAAGKSVNVDLQLHELEDFIAGTTPEGFCLLRIAAPENIQKDVLTRITKW